ncbi:threonine synthase [Halobacillus karajensis]|uniref:Threonine synthase n=1 Tax=Halobacillus karajensis TaxID=195088 RepID=A0A059NX72_9BACI|nr:threonine synthase [Halobacillus karajensis]CDQ18620.1 Threonine synthase [Halobacillus karajensis]CDQ23308.1 Threonine synthase [Halobacillus karajensis]CDQ26790.1 Threonine synthase [Halobacillus karajensis]
MTFSFLSHLYCPKCMEKYQASLPQHLCHCGSPLLVHYDIDALKELWAPEDLKGRSPDLWRYHEILPLQDPTYITSLGEGMTPLLPLPTVQSDMDIGKLYMKDEGIIPTGSFKARGAAVGVSKAKELGIKELAMPTNGNAGAAWSLYAARASMDSTIVMPVDAPKITRNECALSGAHLFLVDGLISDAGKIVGKSVENSGLYDVSTLREPYRIEGKKTMGLEIAEQLGWRVPDVILYPTGGGVGLIGIYKALKELQQIGWIASDKMPKLVAVQSEGCAPIVDAWEQGKKESEFWAHSETIAFGINVPKALGDFLVLEALYETEGCATTVSDQDLLEEQKVLAQKEGAFICPEGAAAFSAARKLRKQDWIKSEDEVVVLNTGAGIKYPDTVQMEVPVLNPGDNL